VKPKDKLDRRTTKEIEQSLKKRHTELKKFVQSVMTERSTTRPGRPADSAVWATETLHDEVQVSLMDRQSRQVAQIEAALERLGRQDYGICQDCGEFIGLERLRALPFAQRCRPCQSRAELSARRESRPVAAVIYAPEDDV